VACQQATAIALPCAEGAALLAYKRETPAMTLMQLTECALLSLQDKAGVVFNKT
jgi:hypothetical protein